MGLVVFWVVFALRLRVVWSLLAEEMAKPPKILIFFIITKAHAVPESEIKEKKITIGYVYNLTIRIMDFTFFRTYRYVQHSTTLLLHGYNLQQPSSLQLDLFRSVLFEQCCNFGVTSFDSYFQWCPSFELFVNINLLVS